MSDERRIAYMHQGSARLRGTVTRARRKKVSHATQAAAPRTSTRSLARPSQRCPQTFSHAHARNDAHCLSFIQHARMPHTMWCTMLPALLMSAHFAQNTLHTTHEPRAAARERARDGRQARDNAAKHARTEPAPLRARSAPREQRRHTCSAMRRTGLFGATRRLL